MKTLPAISLLAALGFTGCYTQFYSQGYARRAVNGPAEYGYAAAPADTALPFDSTRAAEAAREDSARRSGTVIVNNNYYRENPYYRGYLVDQWEYPFISLGFYSSGYRDYYGAYWWNDPWYRNGYYRGRQGRHHHESYPSGGGGSPGPYQSDKRIFSPAPSRPAKGRRSESTPAPAPAPAPKSSSESGSSESVAPPPSGSGGGSSGEVSSGSGGGSSGSKDRDDHPKSNKGRRR